MLERRLNHTRLAWVAAVLLSFPAAVPASAQRPAPDDLDAYVAEAMRKHRVPGLAIAAVRGDSVLLARGYGVRTAGDTSRVDAHTLFAIGSATKSITGAAMVMLVDDGKLALEDRVADRLPGFELQDPWVTRDFRIRDLFLHRSGIARGDNLFYGTTLSRGEIVRSMRHLPAVAPFRTRFQYHNLTFIAAGEVIAEVGGQGYDEFVRSRILQPLGMTRSTLTIRDLPGRPNVATPHADRGGRISPIPWRNIDNAAASGGLNSSAAEMTRYLRFWLGKGAFEGRRLLSERMVEEATRGQFTVDDRDMVARHGRPMFLAYGLGWFTWPFRDQRAVSHGGRIDGMSAMMGFLPDAGIGVVVLTNLDQTDIDFPLMSYLFDRLLGVPSPRDYVSEFLARTAPNPAGGGTHREPHRAAGTRPSLAAAEYAGTYQHDYLGTLRVTLERDSTLGMQQDRVPSAGGPLEHWHHDSFVAHLRDGVFGDARVTFRLGADGRVQSLIYSLTGPDEWVRVRGTEASRP